MNLLRRFFSAGIQIWELLLVGLLVLVAVYRRGEVPPQSAAEYAYFERTYGPAHNTEREEEWLIRDFFKNKSNGFFVDVGANHYMLGNKTYYLEHNQNWSGIAIEPQFEFAADYPRYRPRTKFFQLFISDVSNEKAKLYVARDSPFTASANREFTAQFGKPDQVREIMTVSLNDLLDREHVTHVDFLSIDIELHEPYALKGFDVERFMPALVCIEGLLPVRQQILDYFARHRYVLVGRYMWVDRENLYFTPLSQLDDSALPSDAASRR
jgi:FkbM family methyltransferase